MNEAIKVLSENYVNGDCNFTFFSGTATGGKLYDQKQETKWLSEGSSDTIEESISVVFKNWQGEGVNRIFDRIVILNHNLKAITADYYDGAAWQSISEASLTLTTGYTIIKLAAPVEAGRVRLNCTTTQTLNAEKAIGELKVCLNILSLTALSSFARSDDQKAMAYRLAGGSLVAWREYTKAGGMLSIENIGKIELAVILPYFKTANFITLVFYDTFNITEIYEFSVVNPPNYTLDRKTEVYTLSMELKEK